MAEEIDLITQVALQLKAEFAQQASSVKRSHVHLFFTLKNHHSLLKFTFEGFYDMLKENMPKTTKFLEALLENDRNGESKKVFFFQNPSKIKHETNNIDLSQLFACWFPSLRER